MFIVRENGRITIRELSEGLQIKYPSWSLMICLWEICLPKIHSFTFNLIVASRTVKTYWVHTNWSRHRTYFTHVLLNVIILNVKNTRSTHSKYCWKQLKWARTLKVVLLHSRVQGYCNSPDNYCSKLVYMPNHTVQNCDSIELVITQGVSLPKPALENRINW